MSTGTTIWIFWLTPPPLSLTLIAHPFWIFQAKISRDTERVQFFEFLTRKWFICYASFYVIWSFRPNIQLIVYYWFCFLIGTNSGVHNDSSCSSGPDSPHTSKDLHLDGSGTPTRAQYLSASCVVFTHYSGDTAAVVDEHFSRALNFSNKDNKGE